ncbi:MAG: NAD-dependent epimerase/dehydratase family protein, partial [bacterium]
MVNKVVVFGGAGFIGSNATRWFSNRDCEVVLVDNLSREGTEKNIEWIQSNWRIDFHKVDICSRNEVQEILDEHDDADLILHLAGQVAVTTSIEDPRQDFEDNLLETINILEAMRTLDHSGTLIFASTNKVYGKLNHLEHIEKDTRYEYDSVEGISEQANLDFHSPYGCSKGAADQYVRDYARTFDLNTVVFRQSCIYGPHQFGVED